MKKNIYIYIYCSSNFKQINRKFQFRATDLSLSTTPKNIRKALVFPCFQGS